MSQMHRRLIAVTLIAAVASFGSVSVAFAQSTATPDASGTPTMTKTEKRAARKQARKAHRAAKNAQLSKLEKNGYNPASNDPSYPNNLQAAQKKAGTQ